MLFFMYTIQSSVDDSPEHYGKLKHPGVTQPMPVPAPTDSEYGKIDRVCIYIPVLPTLVATYSI